MNFFLKKATLGTLMLLIAVLFSCTKEIGDDLPADKPAFSSKIKIETIKLFELREESYNLLEDDLIFIKGSNIALTNSQSENYNGKDEIETVSLQTSIVDLENLNGIFSLIDNSKNVLALTLLEDNKQNYDGLILYYSDSNGNLKLESFKKDSKGEMFELINFPANQVSGFTLNNLLFLARNTFPQRNIITYGIRDIAKVIPNTRSDNISMLEFAAKNNLLKSSERYSGLMNQAASPDDLSKVSPGCAVAVHHCLYGHPSQICHPFAGGCRDGKDCSKEEVEYTLLVAGMEVEHQTFVANLVDQELYDFRDWLVTTPKGSFYTGAYYELSPAFKSSLNTSLLLDVVSASSEMMRFVRALAVDDANYVLEPSTFNMFMNILEKSARHSDSMEYKAIIAALVAEFQKYKSRNVVAIKNMLMAE